MSVNDFRTLQKLKISRDIWNFKKLMQNLLEDEEKLETLVYLGLQELLQHQTTVWIWKSDIWMLKTVDLQMGSESESLTIWNPDKWPLGF